MAILMLVIGGMFIFPLTQALLRLTGRHSKLSTTNPLNALGMQTAFIVPLMNFEPVARSRAAHG